MEQLKIIVDIAKIIVILTVVFTTVECVKWLLV